VQGRASERGAMTRAMTPEQRERWNSVRREQRARKRGGAQSSQVKAAVRRAGILEICRRAHPRTVRGIFYLATVAGLVDKTEAAVETVDRDLIFLRETGAIPFEWIVDATRAARWPRTWASGRKLLQAAAQQFRRKLWVDEPARVIVFIESVGLAGLIEPETDRYDVSLWPVQGQSSITMMRDAAKHIVAWERADLAVFVYALGDLDPAGAISTQNIEAKLRRYAGELGGDGEFEFERLGLTWDQAIALRLPTRPTGKKGKAQATMAAKFGSDLSVELDAVEPEVLRSWVRDAIRRHMPDARLAELLEGEQVEREGLIAAVESLDLDDVDEDD
jgi:hypothetical protein